MHRCKDTVGNKPGYDWLTFSLPEDAQKKFSDHCKYLGITEGDELLYQIIIAPRARMRLHHDDRKIVIAMEKVCFQMEKDCRSILQHPSVGDEDKSMLNEMLASLQEMHPLWIEHGARRPKTPEDRALVESGFKTDVTNNV